MTAPATETRTLLWEDNGTRKYRITPPPQCTSPSGNDFVPENGAMFGANGSLCAHGCGAYDGVEYE